MLFLGVLRIATLIVNGARKTVTPRIRVTAAGCGAINWQHLAIDKRQSRQAQHRGTTSNELALDISSRDVCPSSRRLHERQ